MLLDVTMPSLYRVIPYASVDPGEKVSDGLGRAIANFRVLVFSRFNGRIVAKRLPTEYVSVWTALSNSLAEGYSSSRILCPPNTWRVVGAWKETDYVRHSAVQAAWRRIFERVDNPNLLTADELKLEIKYLTQDFAGQLRRSSIQTPYYPVLEVGDTITWQGQMRCIESFRIAMGMSNGEYLANNEIAGRRVV